MSGKPDLAICNYLDEDQVRLYWGDQHVQLPDPGIIEDDLLAEWVHKQVPAKPKLIILTDEEPDDLTRFRFEISLLASPVGAYRKASGASARLATSLELACDGRLVATLVEAKVPLLTWAAFKRINDLDLDEIPAGTPGRLGRLGIAAFRMVRHNLDHPVLVNRHFPAPGDDGAQAALLRDTFRNDVNPTLHDPHVFPSDLDAIGRIAWTGIDQKGVCAALEAIGMAVTGGMRPARLEITPATSPAGLPMGAATIALSPADMEEARQNLNQLRFILECLLVEWNPLGTAFGVDDIPGYRQGITRSDFNDNIIHLDITVLAASGHQLITASETTRTWIERIAAAKAWETDPCFGRRTGMLPEDAPGLIAGLLRRFA